MPEVLQLYKKEGETPLATIERFRADRPEYEKVPMTYLGRLDPMAEGLLLVLAGDTRNKKEYLDLDKQYEFEVLWGFATDTYDVLGLVESVGTIPVKNFDKKLLTLLKGIREKKTQEYPPYSSRTVGGKALHSWAREGKINEVDIPTRAIKIFSLEHIHTRLISQKEVLANIRERISLVRGDFRQEEITARWNEVLQEEGQALISKFVADVSSGTYIRSLANEMGRKLDCGALAYSIKRTRVGEYRI